MEAFSLFVSLQLVDNFSRQIFQAKQGMDQFTKSIDTAKSRLKALQDTMHDFSERLEDISLKSAQAIALPVAGITKAISSFEELEDARVQMEIAFMTKTGLPEEFAQINKQAEELGTDLPGAIKDVYQLASSLRAGGLSAKDIAGGILEGTAKAWVLFKDEVSTAEMAEMATKFANSFKVIPKEFPNLTDELQRLKYASGMKLREIAYSTKYFGNYLQQLGVTGMKAVKLTFPMLGVLKQVGLEGETAGTAMANMLRGIIDFDKNVKKLKDVSISIRAEEFMTEDGFKLEEFLIALRQELEKIQDPLKRMQVMRELFDEEGMRAVGALLARNKDEALAYLETIKNTLSPEEYAILRKQIEAGGFSGIEGMRKAMDEQASLQDRINRATNTWKNVKESFLGTLESLMAVIGELFAEPLKAIFGTLNNVLGSIMEWVRAHQTLAKVIAYPIAGFIALITVLGSLSLVLASALKLLALSVGVFRTVGIVIKFLAIAFNILRTVILITRLAMLLLIAFNPVALVIIGVIGAIATAAWFLWKNWDRVIKLLTAGWNWLKQNWQSLARFLMTVNPFTGIMIAVNHLVKKLFGISLFDAGAKLVKTLWEGIKSMANKPVEAFKDIVQRIRNMLPFSPAKEGPLKDIHRIKLVETIAQSLRPEPLVVAMRSTLSHLSSQPMSMKPLKPTMPIAASTNIHISFGDIKLTNATQETARAFASELEKQIREVLRKIDNERYRRAY